MCRGILRRAAGRALGSTFGETCHEDALKGLGARLVLYLDHAPLFSMRTSHLGLRRWRIPWWPKDRSILQGWIEFRARYLPTLKNADIGRLITGGVPAWRGLTHSISSLLYVFHRKTMIGSPLESETVVTLFPKCDLCREVETL